MAESFRLGSNPFQGESGMITPLFRWLMPDYRYTYNHCGDVTQRVENSTGEIISTLDLTYDAEKMLAGVTKTHGAMIENYVIKKNIL